MFLLGTFIVGLTQPSLDICDAFDLQRLVARRSPVIPLLVFLGVFPRLLNVVRYATCGACICSVRSNAIYHSSVYPIHGNLFYSGIRSEDVRPIAMNSGRMY